MIPTLALPTPDTPQVAIPAGWINVPGKPVNPDTLLGSPNRRAYVVKSSVPGLPPGSPDRNPPLEIEFFAIDANGNPTGGPYPPLEIPFPFPLASPGPLTLDQELANDDAGGAYGVAYDYCSPTRPGIPYWADRYEKANAAGNTWAAATALKWLTWMLLGAARLYNGPVQYQGQVIPVPPATMQLPAVG